MQRLQRARERRPAESPSLEVGLGHHVDDQHVGPALDGDHRGHDATVERDGGRAGGQELAPAAGEVLPQLTVGVVHRVQGLDGEVPVEVVPVGLLVQTREEGFVGRPNRSHFGARRHRCGRHRCGRGERHLGPAVRGKPAFPHHRRLFVRREPGQRTGGEGDRPRRALREGEGRPIELGTRVRGGEVQETDRHAEGTGRLPEHNPPGLPIGREETPGRAGRTDRRLEGRKPIANILSGHEPGPERVRRERERGRLVEGERDEGQSHAGFTRGLL